MNYTDTLILFRSIYMDFGNVFVYHSISVNERGLQEQYLKT